MMCNDDNKIDLLEMFKTALSEEYEILTGNSGKDGIERYLEEK